MVANVITMLVLGAVLCFYNVWLTLIGIGFSLINFLVLAKLTAKRKEANLSASLEMGKVQGCKKWILYSRRYNSIPGVKGT